jgi:hypothetical protein
MLDMGEYRDGAGRVAAWDTKPGAVGAGDIEGMVSFFSAVDALDGAVASTMFAVLAGVPAFGGVICVWVSAATEIATNCIAFQLANRVIGCMAEAMAACALA